MNHVDPDGYAAKGHCRTQCALCTRLMDFGEMTEREIQSYSLVMLGSAFNQLFTALEQL